MHSETLPAPVTTHGADRAVSAWREQAVEWAIHLGDLIDGFQPKNESDAALDMLLAEFDQLQRPHWHVLANHDLYNFERKVSPLHCASECKLSGQEEFQISRLPVCKAPHAGAESMLLCSRCSIPGWG